MLEHNLQQYLLNMYPQENARCEWKEYKILRTLSVGTRKMMSYPMCRLLSTYS